MHWVERKHAIGPAFSGPTLFPFPPTVLRHLSTALMCPLGRSTSATCNIIRVASARHAVGCADLHVHIHKSLITISKLFASPPAVQIHISSMDPNVGDMAALLMDPEELTLFLCSSRLFQDTAISTQFESCFFRNSWTP